MDQTWAKVLQFCWERTHFRDQSHDFEHACEVSTLATTFFDETINNSKNEGEEKALVEGWSNEDSRWVVKIAGLLHDVPDYKYVSSVEEEMKCIQEFLQTETPLNSEQIQVILDICDNISFSKEGKKQVLKI
jgi:HD superfamily phosphodiesterase